MNQHSTNRWLLVGVVAVLAGAGMVAVFESSHAEDAALEEQNRAQATLENWRLETASDAVKPVRQRDGISPIKPKPESLLKWQNSVNKNVPGNIFVRTKDGRPELWERNSKRQNQIPTNRIQPMLLSWNLDFGNLNFPRLKRGA